jgi:peptidylprolyl isomerase
MDGKLIKDAEQPFTIPLSQTIRGFQMGMAGAKVGEKRKIYVHPEYGFGKMGRKSPNKLLIYEVTIVEKIK